MKNGQSKQKKKHPEASGNQARPKIGLKVL